MVPFKTGTAPVTDPAEQLCLVMGARFAKCRLLSRSEAQVLYAAEKAIDTAGLKWRVMAQVSLGECLSSPDARAYSAINSKRVDLLIAPAVAIRLRPLRARDTATTKELLQREMLLRKRNCEGLRSDTSRSHPRAARDHGRCGQFLHSRSCRNESCRRLSFLGGPGLRRLDRLRTLAAARAGYEPVFRPHVALGPVSRVPLLASRPPRIALPPLR